jgi:exopolyphosphatase/pppGpp-phosphohydrolase
MATGPTRQPIAGTLTRQAVAVMASFLPLLTTSSGSPRQMCAIDMGSNNFRRIIGSLANGQYVQTIETLRLGVGDDLAAHGRISEPKLVEIEKALSGFKLSCDRAGASPAIAVATAAFRDAPNTDVVIKMAARLGIAMEVATERRESELAYLVGSLGRDGYAVIDNGSRSIELVARENGAYRFSVFNLGYRVAYEKFFAPATDALEAYQAFDARLKQEWSRALFMKGKQKLVGVEFGDMTEVLFPPAKLEGRVLTLQALKDKLREVTTVSPDGFEALKNKKDIDRALPRLVVAVSMMETFGYSQMELTERELGAGLIIEAALKAAHEMR